MFFYRCPKFTHNAFMFYRAHVTLIARRNKSLCLPVRSLLQFPLPTPLPKSFLHYVKQHCCSCGQLAQSQGQASTTWYESINPIVPQNEHLLTAAFRIFRLLLKQNNHNTHVQMMKHDVLKPILDLTIQESRRDNLLSCSCQEYFENMRRVSIRRIQELSQFILSPII
jgi:hypothetical protein